MAIMAVLPLALAAAPICPPDAKATFIQMGSDCHPTATPNAYCDISVYVYSLTVTLGPHANSDVSFSAYAQPTMDMTPAPAPDKQTCSIKPVPNNLPSSPKQFSPIRSSSSASLAAPSIPNSAGVEGGLVILTWGNGLAKSCKMVTGADGTVSAKVNYPPGATCSQVRTVFCPYTKDNTLEDGQTTMAECAGLADDNGKPITRLDWKNPLLKDCTGAAQNTVHGSLSNQDLGNDYRSSAESVTICNNQPSDSQTSFCWGLALVFGLLFSASFISGRNPLMFFDFGVARSVRMNRAAGAYTPITQNVSVNPASVLDAVDKAGSMVGAAVSSTEDVTAKEDIKDDKGNVVVKKGDVIKTAGEVKKDNMKAASKQGFVSKSVGDLVSAGSDSLYGAITFQSADKMKADRAEGKTGFSLMGAINTVGQKAMEGMVLGAAGVLAGGKFGKVAMTHAGKEAVSQGTRALSTGMSSGLEAMQKNIDLGKKDKLTGLEKEAGNLRNKADVLKKEAAGLWASGDATGALNKEAEAKKLGEQAGAKETQMAALRGPSDYDKASIMAGQLADVLHVDKSRLKVESSTMTNGYAVKLDGAEVGWVSRPNGQDGPAVCSYKDDSGVNWTVLDPSKSIDGFLNRYQAFGNYMSQGSFILINGRLEEMKGSAAFTNHVGSVIDSIGLFAQGKLNFFELLKTALMPVVGLGMVGANAFSSRGMPRIEEATRSVSYNDQTYYLTATGFYFKDKADGKLKQVGDYDPETGIITMTQDAGKKEDDKNGDNGDYLRNGWSYTISDSGVMTKITGQESGAVEKTVQQGKGVRTVSKPGLVSRALDKMDATLTSMFSFSEAGISGQGGMNILTPDGKEKKQKPASGVTVGMEVNLKNVNGGGVENLTFNVSVVNKGVNGEKDLVVLTCRDLSRNINLQVVAEAARSMDSMGTLEYKITSNDVHAIINRGTGFIIGEKGEKVVTNDQDMILGISNAGGAGIKNSSFTYHGTEFAISTSSWLSAKTKAFGNAIGIGDQQMSGEILYLAPKLNTDNFVAPTMMTIGGKNMEVTITTKSGVDSNASAGDKGANLVIATTIDQKTQYVLDNTKPDAPRTLAIIKRDEKGQAVAYLPDKNNPSKADEKTSVKEFTFRGSTYAIDGVGANLTQGGGQGRIDAQRNGQSRHPRHWPHIGRARRVLESKAVRAQRGSDNPGEWNCLHCARIDSV